MATAQPDAELVRLAGRKLLSTTVTGFPAPTRSNSAIAELLVVTESSVEKHVGNIFNKLDLHPWQDDNRRVLAVIRYLEPDRADGKGTRAD